MASKLEIFECSIFLNSVEINCFKPKKIYVRFQMDEMKMIDITTFDVHEGKNRINLFKGIQFIVRVGCLKAFNTCPLYIYFCNAQSQAICACGFEMCPLVVDAFRNSNPECNNPEFYSEKLILQNRYDQQIGVGYFEFSCRHFSQDLSIIQNYVEEAKPAMETNAVITEQPQLEESARANAIVMTENINRKYEAPIMKDLLVLTKKYQKSRFNLVDEVDELENQVRMIEKSQNLLLQKKNQVQRRKNDVHQPLIPDTSSTHTSDFSYFEDSSDYSNNSTIKLIFKNLEDTCGKSFSHHKTHHCRHKTHHHHHHHHKENNEEEVKQPEPEIKHDQISSKSSKISQTDFDAFMQRQNAASERRKSFIEKSDISYISQNSHISLNQKKPIQKPKSNPPQQQQQQSSSKNAEHAQTQKAEQKPKTQVETKPTSQTEKQIDKPGKQEETSKQEQKPKQDKKSSSDEESAIKDHSSSKKEALQSSSASSKSSNHIDAISTIETLDIPSDSSSKMKSESSKASTKSSKKSSRSSTSRSSSHRSSLSEDFVEEPSESNVIDIGESNVIDIGESSHQDNSSEHKLSFTVTQDSIYDDDVVDVEQKSSTKPISSSSQIKKLDTEEISGLGFTDDIVNESEKSPSHSINEHSSEMKEEDTNSSITESFISKKSDTENKAKTKENLDDIDLSALLDGLNDPLTDTSSITSELKNDLGIDSESTTELKLLKKSKKEEPPPKQDKKEEKEKEDEKEDESEEEKKQGSDKKDQISELQSGIDIDDIFSD